MNENDTIKKYFKCSLCGVQYPESQEKLQNLCINCYEKIINNKDEDLKEIKYNLDDSSSNNRVILQG